MCLMLNLIILCALGVEVWKVQDILDGASDRRAKIYCHIRFAVAIIFAYIALMMLYKAFGVTEENLGDYLRGVI